MNFWLTAATATTFITAFVGLAGLITGSWSLLLAAVCFGIAALAANIAHLTDMSERKRMILDLPPEVQMAIRLRAVKADKTNGEVVCEAIEQVFGADLQSARNAIKEQNEPSTTN